MKLIFHPKLRSFWIIIFSITSFICGAEKIDDTHYRFCVMDFAQITDSDLLQADVNNQIPYLLKANWNSFHGVRIKGYTDNGGNAIKTDTTTIKTFNNISSINVLMTEPYDGSYPSIVHDWYIGVNGVATQRKTEIYITVQAPSGVSLGNIPAKALIGDEITYTTKLEGTFPPRTIHYKYSSSDESVATVSGTKISALNPGKTTITVEASIISQRYGDSYYIGKATADIEVVDNLDPTGISLSEQELSMNVGEKINVNATVMPEDARTSITWSSSDESVATVKDGLVKAEGRGNAFIEATTTNGLSAKCYVTVLGDEDYRCVCIDGLYYDLDRTAHEATVVRKNDLSDDGDFLINSYISGTVNIPEKVEFYGGDYTVTKIGREAFSWCKITSVTLPTTVSVIENGAFCSSSLEDIVLADGITTIESDAFTLTNLESFIIGPNVTIIGEGAFSNCEKLKAVYVNEANPYFVRYNECLYDAALRKLYYVPINSKSVKFADGVERIGNGAFCGNHALTTLEFPGSLKTIGSAAFGDCNNLKKLSFPNALLEIEDYAFSFCDNLKEIDFGSNLKILGESAFGETTRPEIIRINALNPPSAFDNTFSDYNAVLVTPLGRTSVYKKHKVWGKFAKITDDEASSGVNDIEKEDTYGEHLDVYNLQGILLRHDVTEDEVKNLPSGVYIVNGEKTVVK